MSLQREENEGASTTDEENGHNMENFVLCSFAHPTYGPRLQGFLEEEEEELYKVALTCRFALDVLYFCQD